MLLLPLKDVFDVGFGHTFEDRGHTFEAGFSFKNGFALDLGLADLGLADLGLADLGLADLAGLDEGFGALGLGDRGGGGGGMSTVGCSCCFW